MPRARSLSILVLAAAIVAAAPVASAAPAGVAASSPGAVVTFAANPATGALPMPATETWTGPPLLLSDAPETVHSKGILYQDDVNGAFRLFFDHVDGDSENPTLTIGVLATNTSGVPATVELTRVGTGGPSADYFATGQAAERAWMGSTGTTVLKLAPGQTAYLLPALESTPATFGQDVTGIVDGHSSAQVVLSVVAQTHPAPSLHGLRVIPAARNATTGFAMRGTFPHSELRINALADGGLQGLNMGTPRDYIQGHSAVDGLAAAEDYGNYGVLYDVHINVMGGAGPLGVILDPQGGPFAGAGLLGQGYLAPHLVNLPAGGTYAPSPLGSILVGRFALQQNTPLLLHMDWMPPAGSYLPTTLVLSPY